MSHDYNPTTQIADALRECQRMVPPAAMPQLAKAIHTSLAKIDEPMQLAIIGKISSSKSTLVNAILGRDELMSTGQKEVTYNVGWLKYGDPQSNIIIHYKDGSTPRSASRAEFSKLSVSSDHSELDRISYIETFDDSEILRHINIIDTPGLDAQRGRDSQNTLDFISRVRPDAVIMLFTHSVAESILDVVRSFNAGSQFTPLNAIGVLSKIDVLWQETIPRVDTALKIGSKMTQKRKSKSPLLRSTLFDLYPISALLYMASTTLTQADVDDTFAAWSAAPEAFAKSLASMPKFLEADTQLSVDRRQELAGRMGLYGIWLLLRMFKADVEAGRHPSAKTARQIFFTESGAENFSKVLLNHFGSRARLIKLESIYQHIRQSITATRAKASTSDAQLLLNRVEQRLSDAFTAIIHEHCEYEMLNELYSGALSLEPETAEEFRRLCGEFGVSAPERLGLPDDSDVGTLLARARERERYWRGEFNLEQDPVERQWIRVILKSYTLLRARIEAANLALSQAAAFLFNKANPFGNC